MISSNCGGLEPIVRILKNGILRIVCIIIPIGLILFGIIDLGKAIIASEEKEVKQAQSRFIKRLIYGAVIFFVPYIIALIMNLVSIGGDDSEDTQSWSNCWNSIYILK